MFERNLTESGLASQPHSEGKKGYFAPVKRPDPKNVLWANVSALMIKRYGRVHLSKFAEDVGIGLGTVLRMKEQGTSVGIEHP